ncbi:InlB B-repeat-containing protein [Streptococcus agalactiae]
MNNCNKRERFSIRKFNGYIASVLIGMLLTGVINAPNICADTTEVLPNTASVGGRGDNSLLEESSNGTKLNSVGISTVQTPISYSVVYKDINGNEIYRTQKVTTETVQNSNSVQITVTASEMSSVSQLYYYELIEPDTKNITISNTGNTEVVFTVKQKQYQTTLKYFVIYKDEKDNEIFRREDRVIVKKDPQKGDITTNITVNATDIGNTPELSSYHLNENSFKQAEIAERGTNEIVFKVSHFTRKAAIKYSVVYRNENGNEVYRENKEKEFETTEEVATSIVEEKPLNVDEISELNGYRLIGENPNQRVIITEGMTNEVVFYVEDVSSAETGTEGTDVTTVNFYNGNELVATQYVRIGEVLLEPGLPDSNENEFLGWFVEGEDTKVDFNKPTSYKKDISIGANNKELVRVFARYNNSRRVVFKDDNGVVIRVKEVQTGRTVTDKDVAFLSSKDATVFSHWSTVVNGDQIYDFNTPVLHDIELYAVVKHQNIINFDVSGGSEIPNLYINNGSLSSNFLNGHLPVPERKGYNFIQWLDKSTNQPVDANTEVKRNYNLLAQWEPRKDTPYRIVHWIETPSGNREFQGLRYSVGMIEDLKGITESTINFNFNVPLSLKENYELSKNQKMLITINGDGTSVLNIYYERRKSKLTVRYARRNAEGYILKKDGTSTGFRNGIIWPKLGFEFNNIDYVTEVYNVKWGELVAPYLKDPNVIGWYNKTTRVYYSTPYKPKRNFDEVVSEDVARRIDSTPMVYFKDIDTGEIFNSFKASLRSTDFYMYREVEGYDFVRFNNFKNGVRKISARGLSEINIFYRKKRYKVDFISKDFDDKVITENVLFNDKIENIVPKDYVPYVTKKTDSNGISYIFKGWYSDEKGLGEAVDFANVKVPAGGLIYYGVWEKVFIPVIVHNETVLDSNAFDDKYVLLVEPGKTIADKNNVFYGYLNSDGTVKLNSNGTPVINNSRIYSGTLTANDKFDYNGDILHVEWHKLVNGRLESVNPATSQISKQGIIYVPVWNYPIKTLKYNANGGSNPPMGSSLRFRENITLANPVAMVPPKSDMTFVGWNTKPDGGGIRYLPRDELSFRSFIGDSLELFAEWVKDPSKDNVIVNFDPNGGNGSVISTERPKNQVFNIRNHGYNRLGYNLIGWTTDPISTVSKFKTGQKLPASSMTLYALWEEKLEAKVQTVNVFVDKAKVESDKIVVIPNYTESKILSHEVYGLSVNSNGNIIGTPKISRWDKATDEIYEIKIPVQVILNMNYPMGNSIYEVITRYVPVTVQRDTDGDGIPDETDPDDDNDGIPDNRDQQPKTPDTTAPVISAGNATVTEKAPILPKTGEDKSSYIYLLLSILLSLLALFIFGTRDENDSNENIY